jgi:hypothetical protein
MIIVADESSATPIRIDLRTILSVSFFALEVYINRFTTLQPGRISKSPSRLQR